MGLDLGKNTLHMKNLFYLLPILLLFCLSACHKEIAFASSEGVVKESGSNKPIANAKILISNCAGDINSGNVNCQTVDTIFSDANGKYKYYKELITREELAGGVSHYEFMASKKGYLYQLHLVNMPSSGAASQDIILAPSAWLKIHVKNINPFDSNDAIEIRGLYPGDNGGGYKDAVGMDYIKYYKQAGNDSLKISWGVLKNEKFEYGYKKIYLPALDTTTFNLFF